ncbi:uncharacterized protein MONBRDRAFT_30113, partial [Monosiga brevicollis MX1]
MAEPADQAEVLNDARIRWLLDRLTTIFKLGINQLPELLDQSDVAAQDFDDVIAWLEAPKTGLLSFCKQIKLVDAAAVEDESANNGVTSPHEQTVITITVGALPASAAAFPTVYFLKHKARPLEDDLSPEAAHDILSQCIEYGSLQGSSLKSLEKMVSLLYVPLLTMAQQKTESLANANDPQLQTLRQPGNVLELSHAMGDDFLAGMTKFRDHVQRTVQHLESHVRIDVPPTVRKLIAQCRRASGPDPEAVAALSAQLVIWTQAVDRLLEDVNHMDRDGPGPQAELDYWVSRSTSLTALTEQLQVAEVSDTLKTLKQLNAPELEQYNFSVSHLNKQRAEAKDNVRFLTTLERHFRHLAQCPSLPQVTEHLPALMNALRMVWVISRHFNTDERMVALMERIAWLLCQRVKRSVVPRTVLKKELATAIELCEQAVALLQGWESSYLATRETIEQNGRDARWEFDRQRLFRRTTYLIRVLNDLRQVAGITQEFLNIFGNELKKVTGNPQVIQDVVKRVQKLVNFVSELPFEPFDENNATEWGASMDAFYEQVAQIETQAVQFIDESFRSLRSAQGAFEMLQNFQHIRSRETINRQLELKYEDVLAKFAQEVAEVKRIFYEQKADPPHAVNMPPVAGSVKWARSLFERIKSAIIKFQERPSLLESEAGRLVSAQYLEVARDIHGYERTLHKEWSLGAEERLPRMLAENVLTLTAGPGSNGPLASASTARAASSRAAALAANVDVIPDPSALFNRHTRLKVNYLPELRILMAESKYLDILELQVPEKLVNLTLQDEKHHQLQHQLQLVIDRLHGVLSSLDAASERLLALHLKQLTICIYPGLTRINWTSLGVADFASRCEDAMDRFETVWNPIQKIATDIQYNVEHIRNAKLFAPYSVIMDERARVAADQRSMTNAAAAVAASSSPVPGTVNVADARLEAASTLPTFEHEEVPEVMEFAATAESYRAEIEEGLVARYQAVGPLLSKIAVSLGEESAANLVLYYEHWESEFYEALTDMVRLNYEASLDAMRTHPEIFCSVDVQLSVPEIALAPSASELYQVFSRFFRNMLDTCKAFIRWQRGTCLPAPPVVGPDGEPTPFSFYDDVCQDSRVLNLLEELDQTVRRMFALVGNYLSEWKRFRPMWKIDKAGAADKFASHQPSCMEFDEKLRAYLTVADEVRTMPSQHSVLFVQLELDHLKDIVVQGADAWINNLGQALLDSVWQLASGLQERIEQWTNLLKLEPDSLDKLKSILRAIAEVKDSGLDIQLALEDLHERCRTLRMYPAIDVDEERLGIVATVTAAWERVNREAREVDDDLVSVKHKFSRLTAKEVVAFHKSTLALVEEFDAAGPVASGSDMDEGLKRLHDFHEKLAAAAETRAELTDAQQLFGMDIQAYPELNALQTTMERLEVIFAVYQAQRDKRADWSSTLWSDLNVEVLVAGTDEFILRMKRMSEEVRSTSLWRTLSEKLRDFKGSLALLTDLKSDALRPRHWKRLMEATKITFDMNPTTFTLGKLFEM